MKSKKLTKKKLIRIVLFFSIFSIFISILKRCTDDNIEKNKRYTIAYTTDLGWSGGSILNYEYFVNEKIVYGGTRLNVDYDLYLHKWYFIKFSSRINDNARILINMPVPDSIKEAPLMGWSPEEFEKLFGKEIPN